MGRRLRCFKGIVPQLISDTLGNLTRETGNGSHNTDYLYNNLNQQTDRSDDGWKTHTASSYDNRGNLILEQYGKNKKLETSGAYTFDETNRMVEGVNGQAEKSIYAYNGLGALMENTWIIAKNGYGYHDVDADLSAQLVLAANNGNNNGKGNGNKDKPTGSDVKKTSTVVKQFVVDFSRPDFKALQEHEVNGLDYRYVNSDKARLSVVVQGIDTGSASLLDGNGELHAYYHTDYLGTTDYLTSAVNSKVISWTNYNEWGEITHNAVLKCGARELDLVKEYATHDYDAVLNMYYAKARMYDADNRRFPAQDPILDPSGYDLKAYVMIPMGLNQYLYVRNNAMVFIDQLGLAYTMYILQSEYPYKQLAAGTLNDLRFAGFGNIEELDDIINRTGIFDAHAFVDWKTEDVHFDLSSANSFGYSYGFNGSKVPNGASFLLSPQNAYSKDNPAVNRKVYFRYYKCPGKRPTAYLSLRDLAEMMNCSIILEDQSAKIQVKEPSKVRTAGASAVAQAGIRLGTAKGIAWNSNSFALIESISGGAGLPVSISAGAFFAEYNTSEIAKLNGVSFELGGALPGPSTWGLPVAFGYDFTIAMDGSGISGQMFSASAGIGLLPVDAHAQFSYTTVTEGGMKILLKSLLSAWNMTTKGPVSVFFPTNYKFNSLF